MLLFFKVFFLYPPFFCSFLCCASRPVTAGSCYSWNISYDHVICYAFFTIRFFLHYSHISRFWCFLLNFTPMSDFPLENYLFNSIVFSERLHAFEPTMLISKSSCLFNGRRLFPCPTLLFFWLSPFPLVAAAQVILVFAFLPVTLLVTTIQITMIIGGGALYWTTMVGRAVVRWFMLKTNYDFHENRNFFRSLSGHPSKEAGAPATSWDPVSKPFF